MQPRVQPFFHRDSNSWTYVVAEPDGPAAAIIDPVLDFDPRAGRVSTTSAEAVLGHVRDLRLDVRWILETHAHADHLTAGLGDDAYLRHLQSLPPGALPAIDPVEWAQASCAIALQPGLYPPRASIGDSYVNRWRPVAETRLRQGGVHLAVLLNQALAH